MDATVTIWKGIAYLISQLFIFSYTGGYYRLFKLFFFYFDCYFSIHDDSIYLHTRLKPPLNFIYIRIADYAMFIRYNLLSFFCSVFDDRKIAPGV